MRTSILLAALTLVSVAAAQPCPAPADTFWRRDAMPANPPPTPVGFSVVSGLCEGEAAGVVFELPPGMPPQQLTQVVCPFGAAGGTNGLIALMNVEVFDGVSFAGGLPQMGTQVFDLNAQASTDMQVTSTGFNTLDVTAFNITVGQDPMNPRFVVAFRVSLNLNGSCSAGYSANPFTDNAQAVFFCNPTTTPQATSLIDITGQGWRDAATATVSGVPLCPFFYAGVWAIRCCTRDAAPPSPFQVVPVSPLPATAPTSIVLQLAGPGLQAVPYIAGVSLATTPPIPTPYGNIPLAYDPLLLLSLDPLYSGIFVNFTGTFDATGNAFAIINLPAGVANVVVYAAWVGLPPGGGPWAISDPLTIPIQ
jgi:hypothetical protein